MKIFEKYNARADAADSLVCVGLDSAYDRLPARFQGAHDPQFAFNQYIIDATHAHASAYKINTAFYEARGEEGWRAMKLTMDYLRTAYPDILTIADAKRADIGSTNEGYAAAFFDALGFDVITLHPYLGKSALAPFLSREDKACFILCRTSNPGAGEFQDRMIEGKSLWEHVAQKVCDAWNTQGNCGLVAGAAYPDDLRRIRALAPDMVFLVPGIGAQGGSVEAVMASGAAPGGRGLIINSSRAIIFSDDPEEEAKSLKSAINQYR